MNLVLSAEEIDLVVRWAEPEDYDDWMQLARWLQDDATPDSDNITFGDYMLLSNIARQRARALLDDAASSEDDEFKFFTGFIVAAAATIVALLLSMLLWTW